MRPMSVALISWLRVVRSGDYRGWGRGGKGGGNACSFGENAPRRRGVRRGNIIKMRFVRSSKTLVLDNWTQFLTSYIVCLVQETAHEADCGSEIQGTVSVHSRPRGPGRFGDHQARQAGGEAV